MNVVGYFFIKLATLSDIFSQITVKLFNKIMIYKKIYEN